MSNILHYDKRLSPCPICAKQAKGCYTFKDKQNILVTCTSQTEQFVGSYKRSKKVNSNGYSLYASTEDDR